MKVSHKDIISKSILTTATGYLEGYTHSLNPYTGCAFGCTYCYVREMPLNKFRKGEDWGEWVDTKTNATELFMKEISRERKKNRPVILFMSSSTDPYQPVEAKAEITRSVLQAMLEMPPDFLLVQTRSPLVKRDIDLLKQFGDTVRVSMTVETDLDEVRKIFSPSAPPIQARFQALKELTEAGIPNQAAVSPVLPFSDDFPTKLKEITKRAILDDFFMGDGTGGKRTERIGIRILFEEHGYDDWYKRETMKNVISKFETEFPGIGGLVSQPGFLP